jgi:lipopolysaccharide transport system ATP-binding protein
VSGIAIRVDGISKKYKIGAPRKRFPTLRDSVANFFRAPFRKDSVRREESDLWALKDVSFEIRSGEVTGVIGRNGAGKSTLLKILARITMPTEGFAEIHGRVGSLLEVGTGFHPELTGRENVYLNGAILGMRRAEIDRKFDEIVSFAEVERFLETPVKHYSTGMFMRLAFSVAAHLEPEILLVDEVLAVGDAEFQKKCLGKMDGVARQGRTILFVSHNMPAVQSLCSRCVVLRGGRLQSASSVQDGIRLYHADARDSGLEDIHGEVAIANLRVNDSTLPHIPIGSQARFEFDLALRVEATGFRMILVLENSQGAMMLHAVQTDRDLPRVSKRGEYRISLTIPPLNMTPGAYSCYVKFIYNGVNINGRYVSDKVVITFDGEYSSDSAPGLLSPRIEWACEPIPARQVKVVQSVAV